MSLKLEPALVGADPEMFLINAEGKFISAVGLIGGSKRKPRPIGEGCAVQEDNVAVEYNIPPAKTVEDFIKYNQYAIRSITEEVKKRGLFLSITASKVFDNDQLVSKQASIFGCEPDFNAWTKKVNQRPHSDNTNLRSCGAHVHIGCPYDKIQLIRWCDVMLGLSSVLEDMDLDRRKLYGKAGAFRPKEYGVEYRTLSNYWLRSDDLMSKVFERTQEVVRKVGAGYVLEDGEGGMIQQAINESDKELALALIREYQ